MTPTGKGAGSWERWYPNCPSVRGLLICTVVLTGSSAALAGTVDDLKARCPEQALASAAVVSDYALRLAPHVERDGCGVIPLFAAVLADGKSPDGLDRIEDRERKTEGFIRAGAGLLMISPLLSKALHSNSEMVPLLNDAAYTISLGAKDWVRQVAYSVAAKDDLEAAELAGNPELLICDLMAVAADGGTGNDALIRATSSRICREHPEGYSQRALLALYSVVVGGTQTAGAFATAETIVKALGKDRLREITRLADGYSRLMVFLPPTLREVHDAPRMVDAKLTEIRAAYLPLMIRIHDEIVHRYHNELFALLVTESMRQPVIDALEVGGNSERIEHYLVSQFRSKIFHKSVLEGGDCTSDEVVQRLTAFLTIFTPSVIVNKPVKDGYDKHALTLVPLPEFRGNLAVIADWYSEAEWAKDFVFDADDVEMFMLSMSFMPSARAFLGLHNIKSRRRFDDIILTETGLQKSKHPSNANIHDSRQARAWFATLLATKTDWFSQIDSRGDVERSVVQKVETEYGDSSRKFLYILFTSYPSHADPSLYVRFLQGRLPDNAFREHLNEMTNMSVSALGSHEFTTGDMAAPLLSKASNVTSLLPCISAPLVAFCAVAVSSFIYNVIAPEKSRSPAPGFIAEASSLYTIAKVIAVFPGLNHYVNAVEWSVAGLSIINQLTNRPSSPRLYEVKNVCSMLEAH